MNRRGYIVSNALDAIVLWFDSSLEVEVWAAGLEEEFLQSLELCRVFTDKETTKPTLDAYKLQDYVLGRLNDR